MSVDTMAGAWHGPRRCEHCPIRHRALFAGLDTEQLSLVTRPIEQRQLGRGEALFRIGERSDFLFTIRTGLLKLVQYLPDGTQRIVRLLRQGDSVGLEAVLGLPYRHDAVAVERTCACRIPAEVVRRLDEAAPQITRQLFERWQHALSEADAWLSELATGSATARVARLLCRLAEEDPDVPRYLPSREDIAAIIGTTVETASRTVAELRRAGIIEEITPTRVRVHRARLAGVAERVPQEAASRR